jgi:hypothetical protein
MELQVTLSKTSRELQRPSQQSERSAQRVRDQEAPVRDDLQPISVVHGVIGHEKNFRRDEDKQRRDAEREPEYSL